MTDTLTDREYYGARADALTMVALARGISTDEGGAGLADFIDTHPNPRWLVAMLALESARLAPAGNRQLWAAIAALRELAEDSSDHGD